MSINDYVHALEASAREALVETGAIKVCRIHPEVTIRTGDDDAERRAYALATTRLKRGGNLEMREELMSTIKNELDEAADGECPRCAYTKER